MRKIKSVLLMSLDGVVQADSDWQFAYFDQELFAWLSSAWDSSDVALVGRRSFEGYDVCARTSPTPRCWPSSSEPSATSSRGPR